MGLHLVVRALHVNAMWGVALTVCVVRDVDVVSAAQDEAINDSRFLLRLVSAIDARAVKWDLVNECKTGACGCCVSSVPTCAMAS